MTLHALIRYEFHAAMLRRVSQQVAFDEAAARNLVQCPALSTVTTRRLAAAMLSDEPLEITDTAEPISSLPDTDLWLEPTPIPGEEMAHILVVDDEDGVRDILAEML